MAPKLIVYLCTCVQTIGVFIIPNNITQQISQIFDSDTFKCFNACVTRLQSIVLIVFSTNLDNWIVSNSTELYMYTSRYNRPTMHRYENQLSPRVIKSGNISCINYIPMRLLATISQQAVLTGVGPARMNGKVTSTYRRSLASFTLDRRNTLTYTHHCRAHFLLCSTVSRWGCP